MEDHDTDWRLILKRPLEKQDRGGCAMDSSGSEERPVVDSCEHGNEPPDSIVLGMS